jgi:hypothetical protein
MAPSVSTGRRPELLSPCRGDLRLARAAFDRKPRLWPDCRFVAPAATRLVLLLLLIVGPEQKPEPRPGQPMTRLVVRANGSLRLSRQVARRGYRRPVAGLDRHASLWAVGIAGRGHANRLAPPSRLRCGYARRACWYRAPGRVAARVPGSRTCCEQRLAPVSSSRCCLRCPVRNCVGRNWVADTAVGQRDAGIVLEPVARATVAPSWRRCSARPRLPPARCGGRAP